MIIIEGVQSEIKVLGLAQYTATVPTYFLPDTLGSVRQLADTNGNVTLTKSYEPYGTVLSSAGSGSSVFGYTGEQTEFLASLGMTLANCVSPISDKPIAL